MLPITKNNVLKYIPCTSARLEQIFLEHVPMDMSKKRMKLQTRLDMILGNLSKKGMIEVHTIESRVNYRRRSA